MPAPSAPVLVAASLAWALLVPGCALAPRSRVDEAHKLVQALRAENAQMKDTTLTLRAQNQDLAQRAVDDARAIRALEVANEQFEQSILGYQDERETMRAAFRDVERQARGGASPDRASAPDQATGGYRDLARSLPGGSYDDASATLTVPANALFAPGGSRPTAEGNAWLDGLAAQVAATGPDRLFVRLAGSTEDAPVRRAGLGADDAARVLVEKRTQVVRDAVVSRSRVEAGRVEVSALPSP